MRCWFIPCPASTWFDETIHGLKKSHTSVQEVPHRGLLHIYFMNYNYVEVDKEFFPTHCKNYDENVKIEVRMLTVGDAKLLAMIDENNSSNILYQILKRCTRLTNLKLDDMYIADRDYLLFYLRSCSFMKTDQAFKFKIKSCDNCKQPASFDIRLDDLQLDTLDVFEKHFKVFDNIIIIRPPKVRDVQYKLKDAELSRLLTYTNLVEVFGSVEAAITNVLQLDAKNYVLLNNYVDSMKCGIREELLVECPNCGHQINLKWNFTELDLLGTIDIRILLKSILSIAKYTSYQVNDDLLYIEYQMMDQIVAQMMTEENKAYEKANGNILLGG